MKVTKSVRILQKIKGNDGVWRFVPVNKAGNKYLWGDLPGTFFLDWREGSKRRRESVGISPSEALEARRRKTHELVGKMVEGKGWVVEKPIEGEDGTPISEAAEVFLKHVEVHCRSGAVHRLIPSTRGYPLLGIRITKHYLKVS